MKHRVYYLIFSIIFLILIIIGKKIDIIAYSKNEKKKVETILLQPNQKPIKINKINPKKDSEKKPFKEPQFKKQKHFESKIYWENRYKKGGNSGAGSYSNLAEFKAEIINEFVHNNSIELVIEWGMGDGNQLTLAKYKKYIGFDVSITAVNLCKKKFINDSTKNFIWSGEKGFKNNIKGDLALSLDVIYHLVEDDVFNSYMNQLLDSSKKYVIIYSCNFEKFKAVHVRCRKFSDWIEKHKKDWKLIKYIKNKFPYRKGNETHTSFSDFYIYEKKN